MLYRFYVYDEKIVIPTVAETDEGFYVDTRPVLRFAVAQMESWKSAMYMALAEGNKRIPTPEPSDSGSSVLLESLDITKWSVFEKRAVMYTVHANNSYVRIYRTGKGQDGMWEATKTTERIFDVRTPWQYVVDAIVEDAIQQPEAHPIKVGGLMLLPKP
jgi:hypothetical protein